MPQAHCPKCQMLLAPGVSRCRYCGNSLDKDFWERAKEVPNRNASPPAPAVQKKPQPAPKPAKASISTPKKAEPQPSGYVPPSIGWPAKAVGLAIIAILAFFIMTYESDEEAVATDCRSKCFAEEKALPNPPKHFVSGCMQKCLRP